MLNDFFDIDVNGSFDYEYDGINRKYYPDIFLLNTNTIVEVKSSYTYKLDYEKNQKKMQSVIEKGYNFVFIIWDKKTIIKP